MPCRAVMKLIDTDGDNSLSREEIVARVMKMEQDYFSRDLEEQWKRTDKDGDGFVTLQEYAAVAHPDGEYWYMYT